MRQQRSRPLIEAMQAWLAETLGRISGRSALAQAIRDALNDWSGLILFLDDGRLELGRLIRRSASSRQRIILPRAKQCGAGVTLTMKPAAWTFLSGSRIGSLSGHVTRIPSDSATRSDSGKPY